MTYKQGLELSKELGIEEEFNKIYNSIVQDDVEDELLQEEIVYYTFNQLNIDITKYGSN